MSTHPVTGQYLQHMVTTGLVTGFAITNPQPPHDGLPAALAAVLAGALPGNATADAVRAFHSTPIDNGELATLLDLVPPWGRVLLLVQEPTLAPATAAERQALVRAGLDRWRQRHHLG